MKKEDLELMLEKYNCDILSARNAIKYFKDELLLQEDRLIYASLNKEKVVEELRKLNLRQVDKSPDARHKEIEDFKKKAPDLIHKV